MLSVIIPFHNEQETIPELCAHLMPVLDALDEDAEVIAINDGSSDKSLALLLQERDKEDRIKVLSFSRNFGHQTAVSAGIYFAQGDKIIVMDGDLQDPPSLIPSLLEKHREGYDVVYAVRKRRKENIFLKMCYFVFYRLLSKLSSISIPLDTGDFCLMDRKVVNVLKAMPEKSRFIRGMRSWTGFKQIGLEYDRDERFAGEPTYNFRRLLNLALDGMISFSTKPLRVASIAGFVISGLSLLLILFMAIDYFVPISIFGMNVNDIPGRASFVSAILFVGGTQLIFLGLLGEYIGRIFNESKGRPQWVLEKAEGFTSEQLDNDAGWFQ